MKPIAMKLGDIDPDGVRIRVNWDNMQVTGSVFIPCIDTEETKKQLKAVADMKLWTFDTQICVENKKLGVRVWRTS